MAALSNDGNSFDDDEFHDANEEKEKPIDRNKVVGVSLNSVVGLTSPKTFNVAGTVDNQEVVALINPGATHNFISDTLVKKLKLSVSPT